MCTAYLTLKEVLFEQALTFQDSLEAANKQDHPSSDGTLHSYYHRELQEQLSQYHAEVLGWNGDSGVARPRELKFCSSMILASSLLRLHQAVAMAASIVTSVPCKSHSPPGLQGGGCRVGRSGGDPPPPEMALPPAKKGCCCKRQ